MANTNTRRCYKCGETKVYSEFYKNKREKDGLSFDCKVCRKEYNGARQKTKNGLILKIYNSQKFSSNSRDHAAPDYSLAKLRCWVLSQSIFHELYNTWVKSNYDCKMIPSCDRLDDYKPYTLDNLQIMTWQENKDKYYSDKRLGINDKCYIPVVQMDLDGNFIANHVSVKAAGIFAKMNNHHISSCLSGRRKSAGGFRWMRSLGIPIHNNMPRLDAGVS